MAQTGGTAAAVISGQPQNTSPTWSISYAQADTYMCRSSWNHRWQNVDVPVPMYDLGVRACPGTQHVRDRRINHNPMTHTYIPRFPRGPEKVFLAPALSYSLLYQWPTAHAPGKRRTLGPYCQVHHRVQCTDDGRWPDRSWAAKH